MSAALSTSNNVSVSLKDVTKAFASGVVAVDRVNLDLWPGEFVSILGPSGCGKSTVLRMIAGLMEPTRGSVAWSGHGTPGAGADTKPHQGEVGFVFQEPTLMPWTSVARNVSLPFDLRRQGGEETGTRVAAALKQVGLDGFEHAFPRELSGGMRMRVSIARALVTEPAFLLMDEPFAALDEVTRFRINDDLIALWRARRMTVIFVTHSVFESVYLSERVVVMTSRPGRVFTEFKIDAPHPRDQQFRTSAQYAALCRQVSDALTEASGRGGGT
jgi:NitT/TauT family transport system ATP-binding protein